MNKAKSLWDYRGFVWVSVARDLQKIYQGGALLGRFLVLARPLAMVAVYTFVFSHVMAEKVRQIEDGQAYAVFLCSGLFTWFYFSETINRCTKVFQENAALIQKNAFPRLTLPLITFFSVTINFVLIWVIFLVYLIIKGQFVGWPILGLIPLLLIQQALALGVGIIFSYFHVFFRDVGQLAPVVVQCWFWMTPIVYPLDILPEDFRTIIETWNPLAPIVTSYHDIILRGVLPDYGNFIGIGAVAVLALTLGCLLIRFCSDNLADEV